MSALFAAAVALAAALPAPRSFPAQPAPLVQESGDEALRILPDDAVLLLRLESIDALLDLVNRFGAAGGAPSLTSTPLLEDLNLPGDVEHIDPARPVWFALAASTHSPTPVVTFALPARDSQALVESLELAGQGQALAAGSYVGFSNGRNFALRAEPSELASKLRPGLLALHIDLATLIETYRPMIETGLDQMETMVEELGQQQPEQANLGEMTEVYVDLIYDFIDSADQLDVALARQGNALEIAGTLSTLEKSPLAGWGEGPPVQLGPWPAQLDPNQTISMAAAGVWADMMERMKPLTELSISMYPEEVRGLMREWMTSTEAMYSLMGPLHAAGDLGEGGLRMGYLVGCEKPEEFSALLSSMMAKFADGGESLGISFSAPEQVAIEGVSAQRFRMQLDAASLARAMGQQVPQADLEEIAQGMAAIFGKDGLTVTVATRAKSVAVALGGDEAFARTVLAESGAARAQVPPDLQRALEAVEGASSALVYRFDFGRMIGQIRDLASALGESSGELDALPASPLPVCLWGAIRGRVWSSGVQVDLESLLAFVEAATELQPSAADDPDLSQALVEMDLSTLGGALELYAAQHGEYPESLEALVTPDAAGQTFIAELPVDPWDNAYVYEAPRAEGARFRLVCYGADGLPGGEGLDADIDYDSMRPGR